MSILFFTKGDRTVGSSRFRVWQVAEKLKEQYGISYEVIHSIKHSFFTLNASRFRFLFSLSYKLQASSYKFLFVHKSLYPWDAVLLILWARYVFRKRLIYDLDDAEWEHSFLKTLLFVKAAHVVFCGSHPIRQWVEKRTKRAVFLPTAVDAEIYKSYRVTHVPRDSVTVGWVGVGRAHFQDGHFAIVKPALDMLAAAGNRFRFVILGAQNYQPLKDFFQGSVFETVFVDELDWADPASVPRAIHAYQFDIGVMPVSDTSFNSAKCAVKAIEYMACGVPAVVSRVGEAVYLIRDGMNGYIAGTTDEWVRALSELMNDVSLRVRMGEEAQQTIRERYSLVNMIPEIKRLVDDRREI